MRQGNDLASAQSVVFGLDRALHDAPLAHAVLVDAAVVVDRVERAVEDGIELHEVRGRRLGHPRRGDKVELQALVLEEAFVAGDQHGQVVDRVHDGDLRLGRSFLRGHSGLISTLRNFTTPAPY